MGNNRSKARRHWPKYLTLISGSYYFEDPRPRGKKIALGKDFQKARNEAIKAIAWLEGEIGKVGIIEQLSGSAGETMSEWLVSFREKFFEGKDYKDRSLANYRSRIKAIDTGLGDRLLRKIQPLDAMNFLETYTNAGKKHTASVLLKMLIEVGDTAIASGRLDVNPFEKLALPQPKVNRSRLSFEEFMRIYEAAAKMQPWVQNSMALALVSGQRLKDIAGVRFTDIHEGSWHCVQSKGKRPTRVRIPLALTLQVVGWSLGDVVKRCRDNVVSRHLIHHVRHAGARAKPGDAVNQDTISERFTEACEAARITWPKGKTPATFHEIRSLAGRLYKAQGQETEAFMGTANEGEDQDWTEVAEGEVNTQTLLGHKDARTTETYHDPRDGTRAWAKVKVGEFPKNSPKIPHVKDK